MLCAAAVLGSACGSVVLLTVVAAGVVAVGSVVGAAVHSELTQIGVSGGHWLPSAPPQIESPVVGAAVVVVAAAVVVVVSWQDSST